MSKHAKIRFLSFLFLAVVLLVCSIIASKRDTKTFEHSAFLMDTYVTETLYGSDSADSMGYIRQLDSMLSAYDSNSEICKINNGETVSVSSDVLELISAGKNYSEESKGLFDISIFPVTSLWAVNSESPTVPDANAISEALNHTGVDNIIIENGSVSVADGAGIDLGGIAKGYACDKMYSIYSKNPNISGAVVSFGSSILLYGEKPKGSFEVAIRNPDDSEKSIGTLSLDECFISTSGGYERYFEADGVKYSHIFNPKTGCPAQSDFKSVTVITNNGTLGDYLSTAIYVGGKSAISLVPEDCSYLIIGNDDTVYCSKSLSNKFLLSDNTFKVVYE